MSLFKRHLVLLTTLLAMIAARPPGQAQPASGTYQIVSGRFSECCGIGGPIPHHLPDNSQAFVRLEIDPQSNRAQLTILGLDKETVFRIPPLASRPEFTYRLSDGTVFPDRIEFGAPIEQAPGQSTFLSYVVSNTADGLRIHGTVILPCLGCADVPTLFRHTNVLASIEPKASIRCSEVEVCWDAITNRTYQVQHRSDLTTNMWVDLGSPVPGNGAVQCLRDPVPADRPQRYYRVVVVP